MFNLFKIFGSSRKVVAKTTIQKIKADWKSVDIYLKSKQPSQLKQAVIVADKALDNALRDTTQGNTMGERLKNAKDKFDPTTYNLIWEAHKVRNALVHEAGYEPPTYMLTKAVNDLKMGLNKLGVYV